VGRLETHCSQLGQSVGVACFRKRRFEGTGDSRRIGFAAPGGLRLEELPQRDALGFPDGMDAAAAREQNQTAQDRLPPPHISDPHSLRKSPAARSANAGYHRQHGCAQFTEITEFDDSLDRHRLYQT
jgi:hypothetical protein